MNYTVGSFVFISSSNANQKYNRIKLCNESVIKINFLTTSFAFFEVSVAWGMGVWKDANDPLLSSKYCISSNSSKTCSCRLDFRRFRVQSSILGGSHT